MYLLTFKIWWLVFLAAPIAQRFSYQFPKEASWLSRLNLFLTNTVKSLPCYVLFQLCSIQVTILHLYLFPAVGLDIHKNLVLLKDNNSDMNYKRRQKRPSLFPPPAEICLIEDDNETISYASAEKLCNLTKSKTENTSMWVFFSHFFYWWGVG